MMTTRFLKYIPVLSLAVVFAGCKKYLDINDTPNNPLQVQPAQLLSAGLSGTAFASAGDLNRFGSVTMDYFTGTGGSPQGWDIYNTNGADFGNQWRFDLYGGALVSYKKMITRADELNSKAYSGIGKIMLGYTFAFTTDIWGDIPYSQALKGDEYPTEGNTVLQPRVDKQEDIYKGNSSLGIQSLFDLVREGIADLDASSALVPSTKDDLVYGGSLANWRRAGYTVLLKLALQISKREPALAATVINEVVQKDYIKNNSQNLGVKFGNVVGSQSPLWYLINQSSFRDEMIVSTRYVDLLQGLNDPRLPRWVKRACDTCSNYVTLDNGYRGTLPSPTTRWARWTEVITGSNGVGPVRLLTNAQRAFILAEAALTIPGVSIPASNADALYKEGITASMMDAGLDTSVINPYFRNYPANVTLSGSVEEQVEQIITQKYIALTGNPLEAWNDYRRTGYPALEPHQGGVGIDGNRPVRAQYINQEVARNPNFTPTPLPNERVWWDVN
jgi:hypothetical protein